MKAKFRHPKRENGWGMVCSAIVCIMWAVCAWFDAERRTQFAVMAALFLVFMVLLAVYARLQRGMFLRVADGRVEGQTYLHRRVSLPVEQVSYVNEFGDTVILYDRTGRSYVFLRVENALEIREEIFALLARDEPTEETASALRERLQMCRRAWRHKIVFIAAAALCMFGSIAVGAIGTGGRDFPQTTARDWRITGACAAVFVLLLAVMLLLAQRGGKENLRIQSDEWQLRGVMAFLAPLPVENVIAVYLNQFHRERITFYRAEDGIRVHFEQMLKNGMVEDEGEYPEARASQEELLEALGWGDMASFEKRLIRIDVVRGERSLDSFEERRSRIGVVRYE